MDGTREAFEAIGEMLDARSLGALDPETELRLVSISRENPDSLLFAAPGSLLGAAEVLAQMGQHGMGIATRAINLQDRAPIAVHLVALLGCMGLQGAADVLKTADGRGDGIAGRTAAADREDEITRGAASIWLDHRFANGPDSAFWELQGTRVVDWENCPACNQTCLDNKRGVVVQCGSCGAMYGDPDFKPSYSTDSHNWGLMDGHTPWRPMIPSEIKYWGMAKSWIVPPPGLPMPAMMNLKMLGEDVGD